MTPKTLQGWVGALCLASAMGTGCSDVGTHDDDASSANAISTSTTADGVVVLDATDTDGAEVDADRIVFPTISDGVRDQLKAGTVIVGRRGKGTNNARGFLRKVESVSASGDGVEVTTTSASLGDAIQQGAAAMVSDPTDPYSDGESDDAPTTLRPQTVGGDGVDDGSRLHFTHTLDAQPLVTEDNFQAGLDPTVITCSPKFDTSLKLSGARLQELRFVSDDIISIQASVSATAHGEFSRTVNVPLFKNSVALPPQWIGPIPVEETVDVSVDLTCDFSANGSVTAQAGVKVEMGYVFGVEYSGGQWQMVHTSNGATIDPVGPTISGTASATVDCRIVPRVALLFYDVVGPFISVTPRVVATANGSFNSSSGDAPSGTWNVTGSIRADAGLTGQITLPGAPSLSNLVNEGIQETQLNLFTLEKQWNGDI